MIPAHQEAWLLNLSANATMPMANRTRFKSGMNMMSRRMAIACSEERTRQRPNLLFTSPFSASAQYTACNPKLAKWNSS